MKEIYYNPNNVPPTWTLWGMGRVLMKGDGTYKELSNETHILISPEDYYFCERVAHEYKLNLNEFCALVHYARIAKSNLRANESYHPLSELFDSGAEIKELSVTTTRGTVKLIDPYLFFQITRLYKGRQKFETTFGGLIFDLLAYLYNQKKGPSQRHTIIGMICSYLEIYPKGQPLPKEQECENNGKNWKATIKGRVKVWVEKYDL